MEPPIGFEARVLQRIGVSLHSQQHRHPLWHRFALLGAAAATAFGLGLGVWAIGSSPSASTSAPTAPTAPASPGQSLRAAALTMAGGRSVGEVFAYPGPSPWVYMSVDADEAGVAANGMVRCQLQLGDGSTVSMGAFALADGYGHWGAPYPDDVPASVTGVRLLASDGSVLATATFPTGKAVTRG
jgi:hypothetical protein